MAEGIGQMLRQLRVIKGYSQESIAEEINVSLRSYQRYESSETKLSLPTATKLAKLYDISVDEILQRKAAVVEKKKDLVPTVVTVSVHLDGERETLERWVRKLTVINNAIRNDR